MTYLPTMGDDAYETFATSDGALLYKQVVNVMRPRDLETLRVFQTMQYQLNRAAQGLNKKKVAVDGNIGPATAALALATIGMGNGNIEDVAALADDIAKAAQGLANGTGVPRFISGPKPEKKPSYVNPKGIDVASVGGSIKDPSTGASLSSMFENLSTTQKVIAVGAVGAVAVLALLPRKK
jgi:hypothetical protein